MTTEIQQDIEQRLREAEARVQLLLSVGKIALVEWQLDSSHVWYSPEWKQLLGYENAEIGNTMREWEDRVHPEDRENFRRAIEQLRSGAVEKVETEVRLRDCHGTDRWIQLHAALLRNGRGAPQRILASHFDITERKKVMQTLREGEARARAVSDHCPAGIYMAGPDGTMLYVNRALLRILALEDDATLQGKNYLAYFHPEDRSRAAENIRKLLTGEYAYLESEYRVIGVDGAQHLVESYSQAVLDGGRILGFVGTAIDITDERLAEEQRQRFDADLRHTQKLEAVGTLAGGIAHDFNNILSAILGNVELARHDVPPHHPVQQCLTEIFRASIRARNLVRQILTFGRKQSADKRPLALKTLAEEALAIVRAGVPANVELRLEAEPDTPPIYADPTQIHQVLVNLCNNAWQALEGKPGSVLVRISRYRVPATGNTQTPALNPGLYARISVTDTGKGMTHDVVDRIFEPFFTTKPEGQGTGLGLSVVHGIVTSHQGTIEVASEPGRGTTFHVYFPALEVITGTVTSDSTNPFQSPLPRGNGIRILFLDDEEQLVFLATRFLERMGYRVSGFTRPREAIEALRVSPAFFDLAVTDLSMPEMTGFEVAAAWANSRPDLPIILASGNVSDELRAEAKARGIREVFYKPDSVEELCRTIHRLAHAANVESTAPFGQRR